MVMFADDTENYSDEGLSRTNSVGSMTSASGKKKKKVNARSKTSYHFAHPAPILSQKQKLHIRPRLLLQLQKLSDARRPEPVLDVIPPSTFASKLAQRCPAPFRGKDRLGPNDLIIMSSEEYEEPVRNSGKSNEESDEERWSGREVVGTICQMKKGEGGTSGKAEISLHDGSLWEATPLLNGSYEFTSVDEHGIKTTARWVVRRPPNHRRFSTALSGVNPLSLDEDKRLNFSLINPNSRRHPIIASLGRSSIDILDSYPTTSSSTAIHPPTSPIRTLSSQTNASLDDRDPPDRQERRTEYTSPSLRTLITVTAIWVAFRENWSQNFHYQDAMSTPPSAPPVYTVPRKPMRTTSMPVNPGNATVATSNTDQTARSRNSIGNRIIHSGSHLLRHSSISSRASSPSGKENVNVQSTRAQPTRANSTGGAFIQRANSRRPASQMYISNNTEFGTYTTITGGRNSEESNERAIRQNRHPVSYGGSAFLDALKPTSRTPSPLDRAARRQVQSEYFPDVGESTTTTTEEEQTTGKKRFGKLRSLFRLVRRGAGNGAANGDGKGTN
ncbi:MAG: hypothetical protein M1824_006025 [Vezdaea acicularis]|nr:MAG: hypothetical protein M1824_006025 [Vezdaea acicularis]